MLTAVPVVTLGAFLILALRIFESDKIAYVFDATSNMSGTLAAQVKTQLGSVLITCKPIFQDYFLSGSAASGHQFSQEGQKFFGQEPFLDAIGAYRQKQGGGFERVSILEKEAGMLNRLLSPLSGEMASDFGRALSQGRVLKSLGGDRILLFEKFEFEKETTVFLVVTRLSEAAEMFRTSLSQKLYLIDRQGQILFGPQGEKELNLKNTLKLSFLRDLNQKVVQGAETTMDESGEAILASYSKIGFGDLIVVSSVAKEKALSAVGLLLRKSLIFFVILISATVIVSLIASGTITRALSALFVATQKVAEGHFDIQVDVKSNDEVGALAENFNRMAVEVARLLDQTAEKARMESELQTAKTVQETLFPETRNRLAGLEIAGFYEPASECGGDWWHYCVSGGKIYLWIGDATGHGAPAALITSAAKSASTIIESMNVTPSIALSLMNKAICEVSRGRIMMTFFLACFDPKTNIMTYSNASHEAPFLIRKGEGALKKKDLVPMNEVNSPRLGQSKDTVYQETSIQLQKDDLVFFYTDGVADIKSPANEHWGEREFIKSLVAVHKDFPSAADAVTRFSEIFQAFRQGSQLPDDVTFFIVKNENSEGGTAWENSTSNPKSPETA